MGAAHDRRALGALAAIAQQPKKVDNNTPRKPPADEWVTYGHGYAKTRLSQLKQIDSSNVNRSGLARTWETEPLAAANVETTTLMSNGILYGSLDWNAMFRRQCAHR
jgi:glucose dehydrogenase